MKKLILFIVFYFFLCFGFVLAQEKSDEQIVIHRYLVERSFPERLEIPINEKGCQITMNVVSTNSEDHVTWIHSYVSADKKKTFCIYDAPSPDAILEVAEKNGLPVDKITEVTVLDPYFYH